MSEVNPVLGQHGGFAILAGTEMDDEVLNIILELHGGCSGCHLRFSLTLRMIENIFKEHTGIENIRVLNAEML